MTLRSKQGFTLIELLIVIAIIGVLAATVIVSIGSQTGKATTGSVKIGVSSIRTVVTIAALEGKRGSAICDFAFEKISGEKDGWSWKRGTMCKSEDADGGEGEICCSAQGGRWAIWGVTEHPTAYCADSSGFVGNITINRGSAATARVATNRTGGNAGDVVACK